MRWIPLLGFLALLPAPAGATDALSEGRALYKQGQFTKAIEKYVEAAKEHPTDPAVFWNMGFAYRKLGRNSDALAAFEKAGKLDPTHSFASGAGKYEQIVALTRKHVSTPARRPAQPASTKKSSPTSLANMPEVAGLKKAPVYVQEPNWARVNKAYLTGVAEELGKAKSKPVLMLVTATAYRGRQLARYATTIYKAAGLDNAWLLAASRNGAVAVTGPAAKPAVIMAPSKAAIAIRGGDAAGGLEQFARAVVK